MYKMSLTITEHDIALGNKTTDDILRLIAPYAWRVEYGSLRTPKLEEEPNFPSVFEANVSFDRVLRVAQKETRFSWPLAYDDFLDSTKFTGLVYVPSKGAWDVDGMPLVGPLQNPRDRESAFREIEDLVTSIPQLRARKLSEYVGNHGKDGLTKMILDVSNSDVRRVPVNKMVTDRELSPYFSPDEILKIKSAGYQGK
jgi:hypothetical protein